MKWVNLKLGVLSKETPLHFSQGKPIKATILSFLICFSVLFFYKPLDFYELFFPYSIYEVSLPVRIVLAVSLSMIPVTLEWISLLVFQKIIPSKGKKCHLCYGGELLIYLLGATIASGISPLIVWKIFHVFDTPDLIFRNGIFFISFKYSFIIGFLIYLNLKFIDVLIFTRDLHHRIEKEPNQEKKIDFIWLPGDKKNSSLKLAVDAILFFESNRNTISVFYLEDNVVRAYNSKYTLKEIKTIVLENYPSQFYHCHRRFVVNQKHIQKVKGNSRNPILELSNNLIIPVSRTNFLESKEMLQP